MNSKEIKLMILENFIDNFTSSETERDLMKQFAEVYVSEDHVDEIEQGIDKYETHVVMIGVGKICDRRPLESIEGMKFNSVDEVRNAICYDENDSIAVEDVAVMDMTYFMECCNNTDDDTPKEDIIDISKNWIGHVQIKK